MLSKELCSFSLLLERVGTMVKNTNRTMALVGGERQGKQTTAVHCGKGFNGRPQQILEVPREGP